MTLPSIPDRATTRLFLLVPVGAILVHVLIWPAVAQLMRQMLPQNDAVRILFHLMPQLIFGTGIVLLLRLIKDETIWEKLDFRRFKNFSLVIFFGECMGACLVVVFAGLAVRACAQVLGIELPPNTDMKMLSQGDKPVIVATFISAIVLAPLVEELLFRRFLFDGIYGRFRRESSMLPPYIPGVLAAILTAMLFSAVHWDIVKGIPLFVLALYLQWLRWRHGTVLAPMTAHAFSNAVAVVVYIFLM